MKKIITLSLLIVTCFVNAQAYSGKGDTKVGVGVNLQDGGTGIHGTVDFGIGENMSFGFTSTYLLSADDIVYDTSPEKAEFKDRFDAKARFNANIGSVLGLNSNMDVYPGLNLGLRNFGGHLGFRYFFSEGFGLFSEAVFPIASYESSPKGFEKYNNQFSLNIGVSFNIQ